MVGLFLLEKINKIIPKEDMGIYRDDGLSVIPDNGPNAARTVKKLHKLFNKFQLSIQAETGIKTTDFLDVILDLNTGKTKPFRKENDKPIYINTESNHQPSVIKQLPTMISSRLSGLSSGLEEFDDSKPIYQKALEEAGYSDMLKFTGNTTSQPKQNTKRKRKRNIIWYTPPIKKDIQQKHCQNII